MLPLNRRGSITLSRRTNRVERGEWDSNPRPSNGGCYCILLIFVALISSEDTNCLENAFKIKSCSDGHHDDTGSFLEFSNLIS